MGFWTKIRKPLVGAGIGIGVGALLGGPFGAVAGGVIGGAVGTQQTFTEMDKKEARKKQQALQVQQIQQEQIAQLTEQKVIASESARLQEEQARKRTLFAGTDLGQTFERKKLLGL